MKKKKISKKKLQKILFIVGSLLAVVCVILDELPLNISPLYYLPLSLMSAIMIGYKTYKKAFDLIKMKVIDENLLVTISVFGALAIGVFFPTQTNVIGSCEGLMVIFLYTIGKMLEAKAVNKSRDSISALLEFQPEYAVIKNENGETKVDPDEVEIGSIIIVRPGEKVALDGIIVNGCANIDTKSLTGESEPITLKQNDEILSGSIVLDAVLEIKTTATYENSTVVKILNLIENASEKKSKVENFISKFSRYYTLGVIILAILTSIIAGIALQNFATGIYRGLGFLVCSCPCAFAISVPLTYFSGVGNASSKGILVKGTNYLDACAKLEKIMFDKTGTLTTGQFDVVKIESTSNLSENEILSLCAYGEQNSLHPIAQGILRKAKENNIELKPVENFKEIVGTGISFTFENQNYMLEKDNLDKLKSHTSINLTSNGKLLGKIELQDKIKTSSFTTIKKLKSLNIKSTILSGDNEIVTQNVANKLDVDSYHSSLLPQEKFEIIEKTIKEKPEKSMVAYVGDGLNDAPSLTMADVGISMGISGSQASIEASDIVLVDDNPSKIITLINISKYTKKVVIENITFAAVTKIVCLGAIAFFGASLLLGVLADVGVTVLATLNSLKALKYKEKD